MNAAEVPTLAHVERDELFRFLVEHVKDYAIFMLDPEGRVVSWNDGAERIKGYSAPEVIGKHFSVFYLPEDVKRGHPAEVLRAAAVDGSYAEESWRQRKDGTRFWASIVVTAVRSDDGGLIGFAKITRDLTERRIAEEDRLQRIRAEEALRARDEVLSVAAHELKTPMTAAKVAVQLMVRRAHRAGIQLDPSLADALEIVDRQIDKLALLVTHLLVSVRIQHGRLALELETCDVVALTRENAAAVAAATGRRIDVVGADSLSTTLDRLRMDQVLTNLLDNAVKHSPPETAIEVHISEPDPTTVEIAVRDRGVGVPEDRRADLFERYFQAHEDQTGMGLGLYISRTIVEKHGGTIVAEFPAGGGSRFVVRLPRR